MPVGEFIDALHELREEGLIRLIGASNWSLSRFAESIAYSEVSGKDSFSLLSNNFSLARMLEPVWPGCESCSEDDFKKFLKEKQIAIFPWSSQARGFFLDRQEFEGSLHIANPNQQEQNRVWSNIDICFSFKNSLKSSSEQLSQPGQTGSSILAKLKLLLNKLKEILPDVSA